MKPLRELVKEFDTPKGLEGHGYVEHYEKYFEPIRDNVTKILEIGIGRVHEAASLKLWNEYFPNAKIIGLDVNKFNLGLERVKTFHGDQASRRQLKSIIDIVGGDFDIIIDDGGHWSYQQQITLGCLFKYLKPGGLYAIEDIIVPYMHTYDYMVDDSKRCDCLNGPKSVRDLFRVPLEILQILSYGSVPKDEWGEPMLDIGKYGVYKDCSNSTYNVIKNNFKNPYMLQEEIDYLNQNVKRYEFHTEGNIPIDDLFKTEEKINVLAIIEKK